MRKLVSALVIAAFAVFTVAPAFAASDSNPPGSQNPNANSNSNSNAAQGGQGGNGGNGGQGGQGGSSNAHGGNANAKGGNAKGVGTGVGVGSASANGAVNVTGPNNDTKVYAAPPAMGVASLVAAPETCMGSISTSLSGGNGIVGAGVGFGKTYESENCNRRMNARYLLSLGLTEPALRLLAQDENVAKALRDSGILLPVAGAPAVSALTAAPAAAGVSAPVTKSAKGQDVQAPRSTQDIQSQ